MVMSGGGRENKVREGTGEKQEDKTRGRALGERGGVCVSVCVVGKGHREMEDDLWGDLHLSFRSVSGASDRELVQQAEVPIYPVDDEHLKRRGCTHMANSPCVQRQSAPRRGPGHEHPCPASCTHSPNFPPATHSFFFLPASSPGPPLPCKSFFLFCVHGLKSYGTSPVIWCLKLHARKAGVWDWLPGQGTRSHVLPLRAHMPQ